MINKIKSFFGFGGSSVNLTMEGGLPISWDQNWWQRNQRPVSGGSTAILHACVDAYAQTLAILQPEHFRVRDDGGHDQLKNSALTLVINNPNIYQTRSDFFLYMVKSLMLYGNSYAIAIRNDRNEVIQLHPVHPLSTTVQVVQETGDIFYGIGTTEMIRDAAGYIIPQRDVLHLKLFTPCHMLKGESPIAHAGAAMATNTAISNQQAHFFNNSSRPSGVLSTDQMLKASQMETLREAWENQSTGIAAGKVPVLFGGLKFQPLSVTSNDAQIIEAFQMTIEDIARAFRVPLPLVGSYKHSTYNNVEQLISSWLSSGLGFVMDHVELAIEKFFRLPAVQKFNFKTDNLLRSDFKGRIDGLTKGVAGGLFAPNEARRMEGLPDVKGGEEPRMQAQNRPLSSIDDPPPAPIPPPEPEPDPADEEEEKQLVLKFLRAKLNEQN